MNAESSRIADQLRRAFIRDAWHGPSLLELLGGISPEQARTRPLPPAHNIWELVLHIDFWVHTAWGATQGIALPADDGAAGEWPNVGNADAVTWFDAQDLLFGNVENLAQAMERFDDAKLREIVPGRNYDFYFLFHGIVQHSLYHGGQIAMLKKALSAG